MDSPDDGDGEERFVFLLPAARDGLEKGIIASAALSDGTEFLEGQPGESFSGFQGEVADHIGIQSLGGPEYQMVFAFVEEINGADIRIHMTADDLHNLGEKSLEILSLMEEIGQFAD